MEQRLRNISKVLHQELAELRHEPPFLRSQVCTCPLHRAASLYGLSDLLNITNLVHLF